MREEIERKLAEVSEMPQWRLLKEILKEEIDRFCNIDNLNSFEELAGAKMAKKIFEEFIRKVDGAKDALTFKE